MGKQLLALAAIIVVLFSSCEDDINSSYKLSDATKAFVGYEEGQTWTYDVSVDKNIYLKTRHQIIDTIVEVKKVKTAQKFDYFILEVTSTDRRPSIRFDTTLHLKDSLYLFGEYRVFEEDQVIFDSLSVRRLRSHGTTRDTTIFDAWYTVYDTIFQGDLMYEDVMTVLKKETGEFSKEIRNTKTSEEYIQTKIGSSLNKSQKYVDLLLANSSGFEYYKRQLERKQEFITAFELGYNEGVLDTTRFDEGLGAYSLEQSGDFTIIKAKYDAESETGSTVTNDVEYWMSKSGGVNKIVNNTDKTTWTLK